MREYHFKVAEGESTRVLLQMIDFAIEELRDNAIRYNDWYGFYIKRLK